MQPTVGIDLGTTNAYIAVKDGERPSVIPTAHGGNALPAVVAVAQNGRRLVGEPASSVAVTNAENTVFGVKRLLGRAAGSTSIKSIASKVPYRIARTSEGGVAVRLPQWDASPEEVCALILAELRRQAEQYLDMPVREAVMAVPSHFADPQIEALIEAARMAGWQALTTIEDAVAAAHAYGYIERPGSTVAVYHLGGGTFEFSLLNIGAVATEVVASSGDAFLGGEAIDDRLVDWFVTRSRVRRGVDLSNSAPALQSLRPQVQLAKAALSRAVSAAIALPVVEEGETQEVRFELSRDELDEMAAPLVQRTLEISRRVLEQGRVGPDQIDQVLMVGGQTRLPRVQQMVHELFQQPPLLMPAPEEAIAIGACLAGAGGPADDEPLELAY